MRLSTKSGRKGFTIIELLVVIGIIAALIAAAMPMLGGSRDAALAAKCMANMRNIAEAALVCANRSGERGEYPAAGMYRSPFVRPGFRKPLYSPRRPWISNFGNPGQLNSSSEDKNLVGSVVHFTDAPEQTLFAVTNGVIWDCSGHAFSVYQCPVHARVFEDANGRPPRWSFMMNQEFGFPRDGNNAHGFFGARPESAAIQVSILESGSREQSAARTPDKVLMFAEVQGVDVEDKKHGVSLKAITSGSGFESDAILQYDKESMGFNHRLSKGRYCGHAAFADGHVEKILMPIGWEGRELTRYLCQGFDVPRDGRRYTPNEDDKR